MTRPRPPDDPEGVRRWGSLPVLFACLAAAVLSPAASANSTTQMPFQYGGWIAVDGTHDHAFVSGGSGTSSIVVLDFDGNIVGTIPGQQGASGMVVDESTGTLYAALRDGTAISRIDTATLTETSRMSVAPLSLPTNLALAGGKLWFAHSCQEGGGTGSINLDGTGVKDETSLPGYCPTFATTAGNANLVAVGDVGLSPTTLYVYDVSTDPPTLVQSAWNPGGAGNLRDLAFTPDALGVLSASGAPYMIQEFLAGDLSLAGTYPTGPYPTAVAVTNDGAYVAAGADASYDDDVFVFPVGDTTPIRTWDFGSTGKTLVAGGLAFSPDAGRLFATSTNDATGKLDFRVYNNPAVRLVATTTSLSASASTVAYGNSVTLTAHVAGPGGGTMRLYAQPYGGTKTLLRTSAVNSAGNASFTVQPPAKTTYTAEFVENDTYAASTSSARTVSVRSRTTIALSGGYGSSGKYRLYHVRRNAYMRCTVVPNHVGRALKFVVQRYASGTWRTIATGSYPIDSTGSSYAYFYTNLRSSYRARCVFAGDADHLGSKSVWKYLKFTS